MIFLEFSLGVDHSEAGGEPSGGSKKAGVIALRRHQLNADIEAYTVTRTTAEWVQALNDAGVPCGPINSIDETFADPQVMHIGMAATVDHPTRGPIDLVGQPVRFHRTPWQLRKAAPEMGQHTDDILADLGYSDGDIAALRDHKAV